MKRGACDCCDKQNVFVSFGIAAGTETWACAECCGEDEAEWIEQYDLDNSQFGVGA